MLPPSRRGMCARRPSPHRHGPARLRCTRDDRARTASAPGPPHGARRDRPSPSRSTGTDCRHGHGRIDGFLVRPRCAPSSGYSPLVGLFDGVPSGDTVRGLKLARSTAGEASVEPSRECFAAGSSAVVRVPGAPPEGNTSVATNADSDVSGSIPSCSDTSKWCVRATRTAAGVSPAATFALASASATRESRGRSVARRVHQTTA